jgi:RNA polymerase sigma-70 factor (ECF subfamily)
MYRSLDPRRSGVGLVAVDPSPWVRRFHDGDRAVIEELYREHFETVGRAVGSLLGAADRETVIHEVFFRLLTQPALRASFRDGDPGAWLAVVARNHAIDCARRRSREVPAGSGGDLGAADAGDSGEAAMQARMLIERFRREVLPPKWAGVFEARFIRQLTQQDAAAMVGVGRTTLAYQEARVRRLLRRFLLKGKPSR